MFGALRRPMARAFESAENPLNHIGAMTVFFLWIVLISFSFAPASPARSSPLNT